MDSHIGGVRSDCTAAKQVLQQNRLGRSEFRGGAGGVEHQVTFQRWTVCEFDDDPVCGRLNFSMEPAWTCSCPVSCELVIWE